MSHRATLITNDGSETPVEVNLVHLSSGERSFKALKVFGIFLAIAIVTAFIPILHFILVPAALLAGLFLSLKTYLQTSTMIETVQTQCPNCQAPLQIKTQPARFPIKDTCNQCCKQYKLELG